MAAAARVQYPRLGLVALVSLLIASAWLVFPYFIHGRELLQDAGDKARLIKGGNVSQYLTRYLVNHPDLELSATFATEEFFQYVDRAQVVGNLRPDRNFIFFVSENIHEGQLSFDLPEVSLHMGDRVFKPEVSSGPNVAEHHRITLYSFPKRDADGHFIDIDGYDNIRLHVSNYYLGSKQKLTFVGVWEAPYALPAELASRAGITPLAMLALGAGLLSSVLTPCLLQLVVIFGSIIGGFATVPGEGAQDRGELTVVIRGKIMLIALAFVAGFTLLYTLAGALIGAVGHRAQLLIAEHSRTVAIVSGLVVILMGLWVGIRGGRNDLCRIPDRKALKFQSARDMAGSVLVSMGYALGCTACFGGAIVATLIVYVGAIGSAAIGAGIMLTFSLGVAVPFLLSAWYLSRMNSVLLFLSTHARLISILSMLLILVFGLILITDNFHVVSDLIYPHLGLG
jgi:cytochrome c-type biogenesis protein